MVQLDQPLLGPRNGVLINVRVTNEGDEPVRYPGAASPECRYVGDVRVEFGRIELGQGRNDWKDTQASLKQSLLEGYPLPVILRPQPAPRGCDATGLPAELLPGASVESHLTWDARFGDGYPAPEGQYDLDVRFVLFRGPDDTHAPLQLTLPIHTDAQVAPVPAGEVIDRALMDPRIAAWLASHPASSWTAAARLTYVPETHAWELVVDDGALRVSVGNDGRGLITVVAAQT